MSQIKDGGQAFPSTEANGLNSGMPGMTLRDYFAAQALPAVMAIDWPHIGGSPLERLEAYGRLAYQQADAMLRGREHP